MTKKKNEKIKKISDKEKNWYIFQMLKLSADFIGDVRHIRTSFNLPIKTNNPRDFNELGLVVEKFKRETGDELYLSLTNAIKKLSSKYGLGSSWLFFLFYYVLTDAEIFTPNTMLDITTEAEAEQDQKITIEINQYTTFEDLKKAWKNIEAIQAKTWTNKVAERITDKTIRNYILFISNLRTQHKREYYDGVEAESRNDKNSANYNKKDKKKMSDLDYVSYVWNEYFDIIGEDGDDFLYTKENEDLKRVAVLKKIFKRMTEHLREISPRDN